MAPNLQDGRPELEAFEQHINAGSNTFERPNSLLQLEERQHYKGGNWLSLLGAYV